MTNTKNVVEKSTKKDTKLVTPVPTRGRVFEGTVTKKFPMRIVIEAERTVFVKKYERFYKKVMRVHARIPTGFEVQVGDYVRVQECRPLSKIIHAVLIEVVRKAGVKQ
ncbi:MAG TPA: 30S ribosomal protein S17 [Candidatus Nanoarchaeia archaeon]|nr:30S ribosomal protein S17 [Candidatus Nanoarchaeia archaeon]